MRHVAIVRNDFESFHRLRVTNDIVQEDWPVFLYPVRSFFRTVPFVSLLLSHQMEEQSTVSGFSSVLDRSVLVYFVLLLFGSLTMVARSPLTAHPYDFLKLCAQHQWMTRLAPFCFFYGKTRMRSPLDGKIRELPPFTINL